MPDVLVVNASPLIFLRNAGRIDLLRATGAGRIIVKQEMDASDARALELGLAEEGVASYDAIAENAERVYDEAFLRDPGPRRRPDHQAQPQGGLDRAASRPGARQDSRGREARAPQTWGPRG